MNTVNLLTWLDIRRIIRSQTNYGNNLPEGIVKIQCYSDGLEIYLQTEKNISNAITALKKWFKDWYQEEQSAIQFDFGEAKLPVEFIFGEEILPNNIELRPFWEEVAYLESELETENLIKLPPVYTENPKLIAFYSFKGGVGRTLNLAAHLFALLKEANKSENPITVLVIDADLEAPGLTFWNDFEKQKPAVSFINFLEVYHYSPIDIEESFSLFAQEVKKTIKKEGKSKIYFLPACLEPEQLLDISILPEHLVRNLDGVWEYGNAIHHLGKALEADYVFIDLRAGLSEISSPIIFDPRFQRFLVTTINGQSVTGTSLVLKQIGKVAPTQTDVDDEKYYDPSLVITMLTPELISLPGYTDTLENFRDAYLPRQEDNLYSTRLQIKETEFTERLLYVNSWEEARSKISETSLMENAREWAKTQSISKDTQQSPSINQNIEKSEINQNIEKSELLIQVQKIQDLCRRYEFAESGQGDDLLITEPLQNLVTNYRNELPHVVSIGAKGAGKTFNYIQLSRFKYWEKFLHYVDRNHKTDLKTHIFPLLASKNLQDNATKVIQEARDEVRVALGDNVPQFVDSECRDRIINAFTNDWNEIKWTEFWISEIAKAININLDVNTPYTLTTINHQLKNKGLRIIFLFDGLEDIFSEIASNHQQKIALKTLIDDLPKKLSEIRQSNIGVIIFLRRDFLRYTITQNLKQFESLYGAYDLSWDHESFVKLVYWICSESNIINANKEKIYSLSKENIVHELENLWGKTLGTDKSKEAYTANWVFAALTDFNGRLQARDIVRFLYNAANITLNKAKEVQFEKWSTSRLLPPQSIRRALKPCSEEKVREAKEEYPSFKIWVENILPLYTSELTIPFAVEQFEMNQQTVAMLQEMGVIYEDKEKEEIARFYMPEIFREGLGFSGAGARPRILALKRKVLGKGII